MQPHPVQKPESSCFCEVADTVTKLLVVALLVVATFTLASFRLWRLVLSSETAADTTKIWIDVVLSASTIIALHALVHRRLYQIRHILSSAGFWILDNELDASLRNRYWLFVGVSIGSWMCTVVPAFMIRDPVGAYTTVTMLFMFNIFGTTAAWLVLIIGQAELCGLFGAFVEVGNEVRVRV